MPLLAYEETMSRNILVLNGPNLNMLGVREPDVYGRVTLAELQGRCEKVAAALKLTLDFRQSNSEAELVGWIQAARQGVAGLILNAGAYTHTSVAILDALKAAGVPTIEVHLSNIFQRETFRHHSYVALAARGIIAGLGPIGYELALRALALMIDEKD
jgi:3-dehydroquinate dehydratase-2